MANGNFIPRGNPTLERGVASASAPDVYDSEVRTAPITINPPDASDFTREEIELGQNTVIELRRELGELVLTPESEIGNLDIDGNTRNLLRRYHNIQNALELTNDSTREVSTAKDKILVGATEVGSRLPYAAAGAAVGSLFSPVGTAVGFGMGYIAKDIADLSTMAYNAITKNNVRLPSNIQDERMRDLGFTHTRPETPGEDIASLTAELIVPSGYMIKATANASKIARLFGANPNLQNIASQTAGHGSNYIYHKTGNPWLALPVGLALGVTSVPVAKQLKNTFDYMAMGKSAKHGMGVKDAKAKYGDLRDDPNLKNIKLSPTYLDDAIENIRSDLFDLDLNSEQISPGLRPLLSLRRKENVSLNAHENFLMEQKARRFDLSEKAKSTKLTPAENTEFKVLNTVINRVEQAMDNLGEESIIALPIRGIAGEKTVSQTWSDVKKYRVMYRDIKIAERLDDIIKNAGSLKKGNAYTYIQDSVKELLEDPNIKMSQIQRTEFNRFTRIGGASGIELGKALATIVGKLLPQRGMNTIRNLLVVTAAGGMAYINPAVGGAILASIGTASALNLGARRILNVLEANNIQAARDSFLGDTLIGLNKAYEQRAIKLQALRGSSVPTTETENERMAKILQHGT